MRYLARGGEYHRVCKPEWSDCSDTRHSLRGGRWNPPGSFEVLYLNRTERTAALQALANFRGEAHSLLDLRPERRPELQGFEVAEGEFVDAVGSEGLVEIGLPADYPAGHEGGSAWPVCQGIGSAAHAAGAAGIACRSACAGADPARDEELALFVTERRPPATPLRRRAFAEWFPAGLA